MQRLPVQVSAAWYLGILAGGLVFERWANYLWFEIPVVWGQPANIVVSFIVVGLAFALWLPVKTPGSRSIPLTGFLALMGLAWVVHLGLHRYHGDAFNYAALLYLPVLLMLWVKPPTVREGWQAALTFAWLVSLVIVVTRALEMVGALAVKEQPVGVIAFDEERYFLPLNDIIGIDGRWPGPFGHNGDTAMMGALIIVIAFAYWTKSSWIFLFVGGATFLVTNGRASIGAAAAGLVILAMFTTSSRIARLPRSLRIPIGTALLVLGALVMLVRPAGLTGRNNIWPAFIELWIDSPWLGVGGSGIALGNDITQQFGHAHSLYIDELARWGLLGFMSQFAALGLGLVLAARVAGIGAPGPLAVLATYFITGVTEPRNNWISPSATGFLVTLMVLIATAYLTQMRGPTASGQDEESPEESNLTSTIGAEERPGDAKSGSRG